ncbi:MAG: LytR/AlgR family response regulator transcription factor [Bacteroidia bacterium]
MQTDFLQLIDTRRVYRIPLPEITHIESGGSYSTVYTQKGKKYTCSKNMKAIEKQLQGKPDFMRTHKSHIINKKQVKEYCKDNALIVLINDTLIPVARRRRNDFMGWLKKG